MGEAPIPGSNEASVRNESGLHIGRALRNPNRKDERLGCPLFPHLTEIVDIRISVAAIGTENERRVADDESRISGAVAGFDYVAYFRVTGNVPRFGVPHILEQ